MRSLSSSLVVVRQRSYESVCGVPPCELGIYLSSIYMGIEIKLKHASPHRMRPRFVESNPRQIRSIR